jgi:hypothetical protein
VDPSLIAPNSAYQQVMAAFVFVFVFVFLIRKNKHHFTAWRQNIAVSDTIKSQQNKDGKKESQLDATLTVY